jgi:hypothetical protein
VGCGLARSGCDRGKFVSKRISYSDCLLNATLQLTSAQGQVSTYELQARAAQAEAWLHLGESIKVHGWVDLDSLTVSVEE